MAFNELLNYFILIFGAMAVVAFLLRVFQHRARDKNADKLQRPA